MLLIPAIDLQDGICVRLRQGDLTQATHYSNRPDQMARRWYDAGATRLHVVDLNGADSGQPKNEEAIRSILATVGKLMEVQIGGGIRSLDTLDHYFRLGAAYVVLGTAAVRDPAFLRQACTNYTNRIIVALDARDHKVALSGWVDQTDLDVIDTARRCEESGACAILYTDIRRDGMLQGVNIESTLRLARALTVAPVIASGGVSSLDDIRALHAVADQGISGAIIGQALYKGTVNLPEALALLQQLQSA